MRLVQLIGDGIEELWGFPEHVDDEMIQKWYKECTTSGYNDFEEFMQAQYIDIHCERKFVDEIYV